MYLDTGNKTKCFGCEACQQVCPKEAITMVEDSEGFRYPAIDDELCIHCDLCRKACPHAHMPDKHTDGKYVFGGYNNDPEVRFESTSGGAFSAIVEAFCDDNYVVFGAEAKGLLVFHSYITDKKQLSKFRKSKYSQSIIGGSYKKAKKFLQEGKKVLFSGTPCQIAGLYAYFNAVNFIKTEKLLTVEVVCEGVPSPLYIRKLDDSLEKKYGARIEELDYRYTDKPYLGKGRWDFEAMRVTLKNRGDTQEIKKDRWFNPFWSIWLKHLISRPSCYECPFAERGRTADITLGDLWGVHMYCPELYGKNGGSSLIIGNTAKGIGVIKQAEGKMYGHELAFEDALKYQGPMRNHIKVNPDREKCMNDLKSEMTFQEINRKWANPPGIKLLWQKYVWGNRQKVALWNIIRKLKGTQ